MIYRDAYDELFHDLEVRAREAVTASAEGDWGRVSARIAAFEKSSSGPEV